MSELQRRWAKAKMDAMAAEGFDENDEEIEGGDASQASTSLLASPSPPTLTPTAAEARLRVVDYVDLTAASAPINAIDDDAASLSSASSASSTGTVVPSVSQNLFARPQGFSRSRSFEPIPWTTFFERELFLPSPDDSAVVYHAYLTSPVGKGPLFVMHHGAGSSGLSFAVVGAEIRKRMPSAGILSVDAREHGLTKTRSEATTVDAAPTQTADSEASPSPDLRLSTLSSDLLTVILQTKAQMRWTELPPMVLVGHSLGGAVITDLAHSDKLTAAAAPHPSPLLGFAVLDVVEGSAMDALQSMRTYLATRPSGFATLQAGIEWHIRSRTIRNSTSARTSVPSLLVNGSDGGANDGTKGIPVGEDIQAAGGVEIEDKDSRPTTTRGQVLKMSPPRIPPADAAEARRRRRPWQWRTDLEATQPFWENWFTGLSKKFLASKGGKLLMLAGTDRLDTELTIGQMQGKYALQVFPEAGHFIHEDLPEKAAITLVDFYRRNDRTLLVLPPKVSELLAQGKKV